MVRRVPSILWLWISALLVNGSIPENPEVSIVSGRIKGIFRQTKSGRKFAAFLGIPYAEPPLDTLRFEPPVPAKPWNGILDATKPHAVCPQRNIYTRSETVEGEEDCLYLNVYTPKTPESPSKLYPVMIFLHGGGWLCGGGNSHWYPPETLLEKDVVLVVPNYRLAALGLLSTGDAVVPGNNALKDQNLALKWINSNIERFGGNPNKVLLFGESAGGASTHLHLLSPMSQGLFHSAISQSGTALAPWGLTTAKENAEAAKKLAKALKCPTSSSKKMVECLRKVPAHTIVSQDKIFMEWDTDPMIPFKPVIEPNHAGAFLTEHPIDIIKSGRSGNVPWMAGVNSEDGALRAAAIFGNSSLISDFNRDFNRIAPISLFYNYDNIDRDAVSNKIRQFYFGDRKIDESDRPNVIDLYTDGWFLAHTNEALILHKKYSKNPLYYYFFAHHGVGSISVQFGDKEKRYGVCHADELQYLFPIGDAIFPDKVPDSLDKRVSELLSTLWTNFAKYGNPTPEVNAIINTKWKQLEDIDDPEYFIISGGVHRAKGLQEERLKFWRSLPIHWTPILRDEL